MPKKNKKRTKEKKIIEYKSKLERVAEVVDVFTKLRENGLTQQNPDILLFKNLCNEYITDGESRDGKIKLHGTKPSHRIAPPHVFVTKMHQAHKTEASLEGR